MENVEDRPNYQGKITPDDEAVQQPEAKKMFGNPSNSTWYEWIAAGRVPRPFKLGARINGYSRNELQAALEKMKAERGA